MKYEKIELSVFSALFIGGGETYEKYEYVKIENEIYFINQNHWGQFLEKRGCLDNYVDYIMQKGRVPNLFDWIKTGPLCHRYGNVQVAIKEMIKEKALKKGVGGEGDVKNQIKKYIRDGSGQPYIPGSTLKGAFRTALLTAYLRDSKNESTRRKYWDELEKAAFSHEKETPGRFEQSLSKVIHRLEDHIFQTVSGHYEKSLLQGLMVGDATFRSYKMRVVAKRDISYQAATQRKEPHKVALFRECIDKDSYAEFLLGIDEKILEPLRITSFADLLSVLQDFVQWQHDILKPAFPNSYEEELKDIDEKNIDIILGGGTGFINKTIVYALAPCRDQAVHLINAFLQKKFQKNHDRDKQLAPRTLKLLLDDDDGCTYLWGLCRLKKVNEI